MELTKDSSGEAAESTISYQEISKDRHEEPLSSAFLDSGGVGSRDGAIGLRGGARSSDSVARSLRSKTSLRMKYEAETKVIQRKLGNLEEVRQQLGLSRRKMCQLLMVDPSTWTRWSQDPDKVPPHIYRALQWYLALVEKQPEWHPQNAYLGAFKARPVDQALEERLAEKLNRLKQQKEEFERHLEDRLSSLNMDMATVLKKLNDREKVQFGWKLLLLANTVLIFILLLT